MLSPLPFCGSLPWWALAASEGKVTFDNQAPYRRRSQRNHTTILADAGPHRIAANVQLKIAGLYRDTRLNYDKRWPEQTLYALRSAYNPSPFFPLLDDEIAHIILAKHTFLWDLNLALAQLIIRVGQLPVTLLEAAEPTPTEGERDLRRAFDDRNDHTFEQLTNTVPYCQVFSQPFTNNPFRPNLSILDALFNLGPETALLINGMVKPQAIPNNP